MLILMRLDFLTHPSLPLQNLTNFQPLPILKFYHPYLPLIPSTHHSCTTLLIRHVLFVMTLRFISLHLLTHRPNLRKSIKKKPILMVNLHSCLNINPRSPTFPRLLFYLHIPCKPIPKMGFFIGNIVYTSSFSIYLICIMLFSQQKNLVVLKQHLKIPRGFKQCMMKSKHFINNKLGI